MSNLGSKRAVPLAATQRVRDACLCLHVQRAARALARRFDEVFRPLGLTNGQFSLLMALNRPEPASLGGVAALLAMDRTTLTAALKPLQRRGLVKIAVDKTGPPRPPALADRRGARVARQGAAAVERDAQCDRAATRRPRRSADGVARAGVRLGALAVPSSRGA